MSRGRVFVEVIDGKVVRIFRSQGLAYTSQAAMEDRVKEYPRREAVGEIRQQAYELANHRCEKCGKIVTYGQAHMHEIISKGKLGEVSLANAQILCYNCHMGAKNSAHGARRVRFGEN